MLGLYFDVWSSYSWQGLFPLLKWHFIFNFGHLRAIRPVFTIYVNCTGKTRVACKLFHSWYVGTVLFKVLGLLFPPLKSKVGLLKTFPLPHHLKPYLVKPRVIIHPHLTDTWKMHGTSTISTFNESLLFSLSTQTRSGSNWTFVAHRA